MGPTLLIGLLWSLTAIGGIILLNVPPVLAKLPPCGNLYPDGEKVDRCIAIKKQILDLMNKINRATYTESDIKETIGNVEGEVGTSRKNSRIYMATEIVKIADQLVGGTCDALAS